MLPGRRPRQRRRGDRTELPTRATQRGHVWTYDFVFDHTEQGQALKMLAQLAECSRQCHRIRVGRRLDSPVVERSEPAAVIMTLGALFRQHGAPQYLHSENGGEFIAKKLKAWLKLRGTQTVYIEPGHPWENGYAESFIGKFGDECLNEAVFWSVEHAQVVVELWRQHYNEERPHSALGYQTPAEMARKSLLLETAAKANE